MPRRHRDYAAEYARRVRGTARGSPERTRARGKIPQPPLPTGLTRAERHRRSMIRRVETGEHAGGWFTFQPFGKGSLPVMAKHWPARSLYLLVREIAKWPAETPVQVVGFGDLLEGYGADWRGTLHQWRTLATGPAEGPASAASGSGLEPLSWSAANIREIASRVFERVRLYEIRIYP